MNWYYKKKIGLDIKGYWKSIFRITMGIITPMLICLFANRYIRVAGYMEIIIYVCIYVLLALISLWFISFNAFEKQQFLRFCRRFLRLSNKHWCQNHHKPLHRNALQEVARPQRTKKPTRNRSCWGCAKTCFSIANHILPFNFISNVPSFLTRLNAALSDVAGDVIGLGDV